MINSEILTKIKKSDIYHNLSHAKNYFSADVATKAIGFISIPIFTRLLTQSEYGISTVFLSYVGIITVLLSLNSHTAVGRYYFEKTEDYSEFVGTTLTLLMIIFGVFIPLFFLFYNFLNHLINLPSNLLFYILFASVFSIMYSIYYQILAAQQKSKEVAKISIIYGYSGFIVSVILTYFLSSDRYLGKIWASLIIGSIFSIYFLFKLRDSIIFSLNKVHIKYIVSYSFPLIPYSLSNVILAQFDRIMINNIVGSSSAGIYSLGYTIGSLLAMVIAATLTAIFPQAMKFFEDKNYKRMDLLVSRIFSIEIILALGLILFGKEILFLLADEKFHIAANVIPIVVVGYIFYGMSVIYGLYVVNSKKMIYLSISVLSAGMINIFLNLIFIPKYGYVGAAYTTTISYFLMFFLNWIITKYVLLEKSTPLWIFWKSTFLLFLILLVVGGIEHYIVDNIIIILTKLLFIFIFIISLFFKESKTIYLNIIKSNKGKI